MPISNQKFPENKMKNIIATLQIVCVFVTLEIENINELKINSLSREPGLLASLLGEIKRFANQILK